MTDPRQAERGRVQPLVVGGLLWFAVRYWRVQS